MMLGSAPRSGDCPGDPQGAAGPRREREQWYRRRHLQRELHDGAALRISALTLRLGLLRHRALPELPADADGPAVQDSIGELQDELHAVLEELRDVAAKIYPPLLDEAGLGPALRGVADQLQLPVAVVASGERFGPAAEGAAYFAVADLLASLPGARAVPGAQAVELGVRREGDQLVLSVSGIDACRAELHAELIDDRARPLGGTVDVANVVGGVRSDASTITARFPCE
ncbi:MAG TPA: histidine kinase [Pseudonocardiaceae bacterium]